MHVHKFKRVLLMIVLIVVAYSTCAHDVRVAFAGGLISSTSASYPFAGGDGTEASPYLIRTADQLEAVGYYLDKCFVMDNDITFSASDFEENGPYYNSGSGWIPIGESSANPFCGSFDGNGHAITGLVSHSPGTYIGLFGCSTGVIKNLGMNEPTITVSSGQDYAGVGAICGCSYGQIINCYSCNGFIESSKSYDACGGLVGVLNFGGKIAFSWNSSDVSAVYRAGGLSGTVGGNRGIIQECFNAGSIKAEAAGGIVGGMYGLDIADSYNEGFVDGSKYAGGINGTAGNSNHITNCYNRGHITGEDNVGSICGSSYTGSIENVYCLESIRYGRMSYDGVLVTADEFGTEGSFPGFDFSNIWYIEDNHPKLCNIDNGIMTHKLIKHDYKDATCTTSGNNEYYECEYCGILFKSDMSTVTSLDSEAIPAKGHNLEHHEAKEASCLLPGNNEYYVCLNCGKAFRSDMRTETLPKYEVIPAIGHQWSDALSRDSEPTCLKSGSASLHCLICGSSNPDTVVEVEPLGHDYAATVVPPTCTQSGYTEHVCSRCGDSYRDAEVSATGHAWDKPSYMWNDDYSSVTARRSCANDPSHAESEIVAARYEVVVAPTLTSEGMGRWSATFSNPAFAAQSRDVGIPALTPFFLDADPGDDANHGAEVDWMGRAGVSTGWKADDGRMFYGLRHVIRCDLAAFMYRMADLSDDDSRNDSIALTDSEVLSVLEGVSDCTAKTDHAAEVAWMIRSGISRGWPNKGKSTVSFRPYDKVVRQDMAAFLYRFADLRDDGNQNQSLVMGVDAVRFSDVRHGDTGNHAAEVEWLASVGVTKGWAAGNSFQFRGMQNVARQDMAAFMYRLHNRLNQ